MSFTDVMEAVVQVFEVAGVAVLALGSLWALFNAGVAFWRGERVTVYERARSRSGDRSCWGSRSSSSRTSS